MRVQSLPILPILQHKYGCSPIEICARSYQKNSGWCASYIWDTSRVSGLGQPPEVTP
jgi:hypothetical protein